MLIPGNTDIVVQLHYSTIGHAVTDVTKIGFTLAKKEPERELKLYGLEPAGGMFNRKTFHIPAGDSNWKAPPSDVVFNMDTELALLSIHMHERGKAMTFTLTYPDGRSEIVMSQPRRLQLAVLLQPCPAHKDPEGYETTCRRLVR